MHSTSNIMQVLTLRVFSVSIVVLMEVNEELSVYTEGL